MCNRSYYSSLVIINSSRQLSLNVESSCVLNLYLACIWQLYVLCVALPTCIAYICLCAQYLIVYIFAKVEDAWKSTEFIILPHRDSKDVFILGGTDDIQVLLDDSQVNVSTIAGSRHVGPIKPRVDEWDKHLKLFSETLVGLIHNNYVQGLF